MKAGVAVGVGSVFWWRPGASDPPPPASLGDIQVFYWLDDVPALASYPPDIDRDGDQPDIVNTDSAESWSFSLFPGSTDTLSWPVIPTESEMFVYNLFTTDLPGIGVPGDSTPGALGVSDIHLWNKDGKYYHNLTEKTPPARPDPNSPAQPDFDSDFGPKYVAYGNWDAIVLDEAIIQLNLFFERYNWAWRN